MKIKYCEGEALDKRNYETCQVNGKKTNSDIESIIDLIQGTIKELDKLSSYQDKNVYDPISSDKSLHSPHSHKLEYTDYSSDDEGKLISRKTECIITECREKRIVNEENY